MSERLPASYLKGLRQEIFRLHDLLEPLENESVRPEDRALRSLLPLTIERHRSAIKELQRIWDENCDEIQRGDS
jgi:hypothetical protein